MSRHLGVSKRPLQAMVRTLGTGLSTGGSLAGTGEGDGEAGGETGAGQDTGEGDGEAGGETGAGQDTLLYPGQVLEGGWQSCQDDGRGEG